MTRDTRIRCSHYSFVDNRCRAGGRGGQFAVFTRTREKRCRVRCALERYGLACPGSLPFFSSMIAGVCPASIVPLRGLRGPWRQSWSEPRIPTSTMPSIVSAVRCPSHLKQPCSLLEPGVGSGLDRDGPAALGFGRHASLPRRSSRALACRASASTICGIWRPRLCWPKGCRCEPRWRRWAHSEIGVTANLHSHVAPDLKREAARVSELLRGRS